MSTILQVSQIHNPVSMAQHCASPRHSACQDSLILPTMDPDCTSASSSMVHDNTREWTAPTMALLSISHDANHTLRNASGAMYNVHRHVWEETGIDSVPCSPLLL